MRSHRQFRSAKYQTPDFKTERRILCCAVPFKRTLIFINLIFLLFGIVLIALGITALVKLNTVSALIDTGIPVGVIVLGTFIFLLSFLGCLGSWLENKSILLVYLGIIVILIVIEVSVGLATYQRSPSVVINKLDNAWDHTSDNDRNFFQSQFHCCGFDNVTDFPGSNCLPSYNYTIGCGTELQSYFEDNLAIIGIVGVVLAVFQAFALCFSLLLYSCISCCSYEEDVVMGDQLVRLKDDYDDF